METEELIIDDKNFDQYFRDVRRYKPEKGEIMVCYANAAEFVTGNEKRHMIHLLKLPNKMEAATQVMRKLLYACERDAYTVPKMMLKDMLAGMTDEEILEKPYPYTVHIYYYTKPEYFPKDDPHWTSISILNLDMFIEKTQKIKEADVVSEKTVD